MVRGLFQELIVNGCMKDAVALAMAEPRKEKLQGNFMCKGPVAEKSLYVCVVSLSPDGREAHGKLG